MMPRIEKMKQDLGNKKVEATSSNRGVIVCMSGTGIVTRIEIDEALIASGNKTLIESLTLEAMNLAIQQAKALHLSSVREVVGELGIPGIDRILEQLAE